ncbi:uncharacterized protein LOC142179781 [Nicotiana tabacum]|uniref:Uncharacterized protein LOC142179781 n=1 Tax=Nicotiana tabacum TaxID=4097 RepID=A0AC58UBA2_TOBAC
MAIIVTLMNEMDKMSNGNDQLMSNLSCVKLDIKELESDKASLEKQVKDLKNQVLELTSENEKSLDTHCKGKMSDLQDKLEKELKITNDNLCDAECRNKVLSNKSGIDYRKPVPKFDPKYVGISDNDMCTHCGRVVHFRDTCPALIYAQFRNTFGIAKNVKKEEDPKVNPHVHTKWIKDKEKGQITGIGKDGKSLSHAIEDVYYVVGLKRNLLSISQMCDKGNEVKFNSKICIVTKLDTDEIVLKDKRHNNAYKISSMSLPQSEHTCLSVVEDDPLLWHRRLGHASLSHLNKLAAKDLVLGLPKVEFTYDKDEDYDIGFTGDGDTKEYDEDGSENRKEIDSDHEEPEEEITTLTDDQTNEVTHIEPELLGHSSGESSLGIQIRPQKHQSSHPLENINSDPNARVQTRSSLRNLCVLTAFLSQVEPKTITEALKDPNWIIAMQEELNQFERSKVWHLVQKPKNRTVIGTKWVFRNKLDKQGNITKNKVTLMDVKSAFLNGYLEDEVFVKQPPRFESEVFSYYVFKLDKALYGLKQAPRAWYERLSKFLLANNFVRGKVDNTLFLRSRGKNILIVQVYVDDIIFGVTNKAMCKEFTEMMGNEFEMSMMGELNFFLGLQIKQTPTRTMIH